MKARIPRHLATVIGLSTAVWVNMPIAPSEVHAATPQADLARVVIKVTGMR